MTISFNGAAGEISDEGIRYLLIRPDVLMGAARVLAGEQRSAFLQALEISAFEQGRRSFQHYRDSGRFAASDPLPATCRIAASLGWGVWTILAEPQGSTIIEVANSPFAVGFGPSQTPVCAPIVGILRALTLVESGTPAVVAEISCCSQGSGLCRFRLG